MKPFTIQMSVTLDEEMLFDVVQRAVEKAIGFDKQREARLKASRNALFAGEKPPEDQGLLIDTKEASILLKVSARTIWAMSNDGRMPPPIKIGSAVRWSYDALRKWVDAGCPCISK